MIPKKRIRLSAMQRVEVWRRWKAGESLHAIGRALGKNNVVIYLLLKRHGGIAPPIRRRSPSSLTLAEREDISRGIACGSSIRGIAQGLHRCASTIKHWDLKLRRVDCKPVLHRPLETTPVRDSYLESAPCVDTKRILSGDR